MSEAHLRFHGALNDFLPPERRGVAFAAAFQGRPSIKDLIESLGVPHTEVARIVVNGQPVDFAYLVQAGDAIEVAPDPGDAAEGALNLRPAPAEARFVADTHLGRLARALRLLGFDTLYRNDYADAELADVSAREGRVLLTQDRGLLKRRRVVHGYCVRATHPRRQVTEVLERFSLWDGVQPFSRCLRCNGRLAVTGESVEGKVPPAVLRDYAGQHFYRCPGCGRIYWRGSHYDAMRAEVEAILATRPVARDQSAVTDDQ